MPTADRDALIKELTFAGNDPGHAGQISGAPTNYKGDRSMGRWIADAVMVGPIFSSILTQADTAAQAVAERDEAQRRREFTEQWYAERLEHIKDVAKRVGVWSEVAAIIANGSGTRLGDDGKYIYEPPTYAQQLNIAKGKAEAAQADVARLSAEVEAREQENALLREIINAGLAETAFAVADERDGSATDRTRRVRFAGIRDALRGVGDPKRVAALAGQDKTEGDHGQ